MRPHRFAAVLLSASLICGACTRSPGPSDGAQPTGTGGAAASASDAAPAGDGIAEQLVGDWQRAPIPLDDARTAIISDACATAARKRFGEVEANLPTAVIDARGAGRVIAILADDLDAIECLGGIGADGRSTAVDSVERLSMIAVAPVDGPDLSVASLTRDQAPPNGWTIAFGRVGPAAESVKVGFDDNTDVLATAGDGWWALWWIGTARPNSYAAVDTNGLVVGNVKPFDGLREARVGAGTWWLDPAAPPPATTATKVRALIDSPMCASGRSPEGRIEPPTFDLSDTAVTVSFEILWPTGDVQTCQGIPPFPITIQLPEPLGTRALFDGSSDPPRDARTSPAP